MILLAMGGKCLAQVPTAAQAAGNITVNVANVDLTDFLRVIQQASGWSIVVAPGVHGTVTAALRDVPAEQALDAVLRANGLTSEREGNIVTILTLEEARRRAEERRRLAEARLAAAPVTTCTYTLNYAHASEAVSLLRPLLSSRGRIAVDVRNNMLIVTDLPEVLEKLGLYPAATDRGRCF
jgi:type IV pilus assembly protein PilQ